MDLNRLLRWGIVTLTLALAASRGPCQATQTSVDRGQVAAALEQQGDIAGAETAWRDVLKAHPSDAEAFAHLGLLEARQEHYAAAVPLYHKALALRPQMPGLRLNLGLSLFKSGAMREAIETFSTLLKSTSPSSPEAFRLATLIGLAHYGLGDYAAAVPFLRQATAADPQNLPFRLALAHCCLWSKQYQCVLDVYHEILTLNAESAEADMLAGEAMDEMKDSAGALQQFRAAVKADPREPNAHFGLGYLLWGSMQYDEAAQEFQAELANNTENAQAMTYLADSDMRLSHADAASALLEKAIRIEPKIALAHLDLGILAGDAGRKDEALRELKEAEKLSPNDQNIHYRLGRYYQSMGMKAEAKAEFDRTRGIQKASDQSVFDKLHEAQAKGISTKEVVPEK
jgi:tetratricopeptide (TPR) repeat protein